jgi:hypothetical protein
LAKLWRGVAEQEQLGDPNTDPNTAASHRLGLGGVRRRKELVCVLAQRAWTVSLWDVLHRSLNVRGGPVAMDLRKGQNTMGAPSWSLYTSPEQVACLVAVYCYEAVSVPERTSTGMRFTALHSAHRDNAMQGQSRRLPVATWRTLARHARLPIADRTMYNTGSGLLTPACRVYVYVFV